MKYRIFFLLLIFVKLSSFSIDTSYIKDLYPKFFNLYLFNPEIVSVKHFAGNYEVKYEVNRDDSKLYFETSLSKKYEITFNQNEVTCQAYDPVGLWNTFSLGFEGNKLKEFDYAYRFMVEGHDEPLMIDETRFYTYDEKGRLLTHKQPTEYSERTFYYEGDNLDYIENIIGNGETSITIKDKVTYLNDKDYDVVPSNELIFFSKHYPTMDKKEHRVTYEGDFEIIRDTYYHNGEVYLEYIEKWKGDRILSFENFISVRNQTVKIFFEYK